MAGGPQHASVPPMKLLVIHQNFPGQFGRLVRAWAARPGWEVRGLGRDSAPGLPGFAALTRYRLVREPAPSQHHYLRQMERAVLHGQAAIRAMLAMKADGFRPDAVLAHPGWGETLYIRGVFPEARLIHLAEWYYATAGADVGFDPEFPATMDDRARVTTWNAVHALNLTHCDAAVAPTHWQRDSHPEIFRPRMSVQHEGIDVAMLAGFRGAEGIRTPNGADLRKGDEVVTFVARNLEPYRGFHVFMRALAVAQRANPRLHALVIGGDGVSYGRPPAGASTWRERMLAEVSVDPSRTHFLGRVPYQEFLQCLQVASAHVYLSYPFVLSWSMLEAAACGVPIIGSDTAPVREFIEDGISGRLVDFFDVPELGRTMASLPELPLARYAEAARARVSALDTAHALQGYDRLLRHG
ncbi:MAG: glycosyltransferase [Xylophilus ampelinus]